MRGERLTYDYKRELKFSEQKFEVFFSFVYKFSTQKMR